MRTKNIHPVRATIALMLSLSVCIMYLHEMTVPEALIGLTGAAIGFYFRGD
ncbi:MAG: hypothetical protein KAX49_03945 [Halanaerobiales bacterium]|nr:hypothetical protein [Halanaerobiales bacterium]